MLSSKGRSARRWPARFFLAVFAVAVTQAQIQPLLASSSPGEDARATRLQRVDRLEVRLSDVYYEAMMRRLLEGRTEENIVWLRERLEAVFRLVDWLRDCRRDRVCSSGPFLEGYERAVLNGQFFPLAAIGHSWGLLSAEDVERVSEVSDGHFTGVLYRFVDALRDASERESFVDEWGAGKVWERLWGIDCGPCFEAFGDRLFRNSKEEDPIWQLRWKAALRSDEQISGRMRQLMERHLH